MSLRTQIVQIQDFRSHPKLSEGSESLTGLYKRGPRRNPDLRISAFSWLGSERPTDPMMRLSGPGPNTLMLFHPKNYVDNLCKYPESCKNKIAYIFRFSYQMSICVIYNTIQINFMRSLFPIIVRRSIYKTSRNK